MKINGLYNNMGLAGAWPAGVARWRALVEYCQARGAQSPIWRALAGPIAWQAA